MQKKKDLSVKELHMSRKLRDKKKRKLFDKSKNVFVKRKKDF